MERMFSSMKVIETNRRTHPDSSTLSDLLDIQVEGPPLASFSADQAALWWDDCKTSRRVNQTPRKDYTPREKGSFSSEVTVAVVESDSQDTGTISLEDCDEWFGPDPSTPAVVEPEPDSDSD